MPYGWLVYGMSKLRNPTMPAPRAFGRRTAPPTLLRRLWAALHVWNLAPTRWLQIGACAVLVFAWVRGADELTAAQIVRQTEGDVAETAGLRIDEGALRAALGLSTIEVIVGRNDTLERIETTITTVEQVDVTLREYIFQLGLQNLQANVGQHITNISQIVKMQKHPGSPDLLV